MKAMPTYKHVVPLTLGDPQQFRRMLCIREVPEFPSIQVGYTYLVEQLRRIGGLPFAFFVGINELDENNKRKLVPLADGQFEPCVHSVDEVPRTSYDWKQIRETLLSIEGHG